MYSLFPIIALSFLLPSHPSQKSGATQLSAKSAVKEPSKEKTGDMIGEAANFHKPGTVHVYFRLQRQTNLRALFFIEKKACSGRIQTTQTPAFKAVALPTESPR